MHIHELGHVVLYVTELERVVGFRSFFLEANS
jgi:hypothetical protein